MNIRNIIASLSSRLSTVAVQYKDADGKGFGAHYTYKTDLELEVGQEVIVDSPSTGLTVVVVSEVHKFAEIDADAAFSYKWVVGKVDVEAHKARLEKEEELAEEFAVMQGKLNKMRKVEELKMALGFGKDEKCEELDSLIEKINAL